MIFTRSSGRALAWLGLTLVAACGSEGKSNQPAVCSDTQMSCDGVCVDTQLDSLNCGGCNLQCPAGATCSLAQCRDANGAVVSAQEVAPTSCGAGLLLCSSECVDPKSSDEHCGACGVPCGAGRVCDSGACRDIGTACPTERSLCGDSCVFFSSDAQNCGACGNSCGEALCQAGVCGCTAPNTLCKLGCSNLAADTSNCGSCGNACGEGQVCDSGSCQCGPGQTSCDGACTNLQTDVANCGGCGNACGGGETCASGQCACSSGLTSCSDECVDLTSSAANCGSCGNVCAGDEVCTASACACPSGETKCGESCADLDTDMAHCGTCGEACSVDKVCTEGACQCAEGMTDCDGTCVDLAGSAENCGTCGNACRDDQVCTESACACPEGQTSCSDACVDTTSDTENCGSCGNACGGGQVCTEGMCECPEGQTFCGESCIDTQTDALNCGDCDVACGLGELCNTGTCAGGGLGEDGCQGVGENLTLSKVSFFQTVEIPVMQEGEAVEQRNVDVVAGRDTMVRVSVEVGAGWSERTLSARLFLDDGEERFTVYTEEPQRISGSSRDDERDSAFELRVSADQLREATRYAVEVVECGDAPGEPALAPRFPEQDGAELGAIRAGGLKVHLIPIRANGRLPTTNDEILEDFRAGFMATYPIDSVEFTIADPYDVQDAEDWTYNLEDLRYLRQSEDPDLAVYYYGLMRPTDRLIEFCGYGCTAGIGYVPYGSGPYAATGRVAMGLAYDDEESIRTMLHEVGHNHGRNHAPCVPPGAYIAGVDPYYPYDNAAIGVYGYDIRNDWLISPNAPDIMAYCPDPWFSDYTYAGLLDTVLSVNQGAFAVRGTPQVGDFQALLVESGKAPRWMSPRLGVAPQGVPQSAEVLDATGAVIDVIDVYKNEMADVSAYSLDVPLPAAGWFALRLADIGVVPF